MRVLVAEDERVTRVTLVRQLEAWGHTVTAVEDGAAAWELLVGGAGVFDIVLTDWEMPNLSGPELIGRLRSLSGAPYVYTVLLTSRSGKSDVVSGIEKGADDYVAKPFDKDELRARLLAGERVVRLERTLAEQNAALRAADERLRRDLQAAARVQRAMLPRGVIETQHVKTAWRYVPTDVLAGDALGLDLIDDRYLVSYVLDVSGHGVSAALLAVTAMHGLAPSSRGMEALQHGLKSQGASPLTATVVAELNKRLSRADNDGRFLTIVLSVLDTHTGRLRFTRGAHPVPILIRDGAVVVMDDRGGMPLAVDDGAEYEEVDMQLRPGDRLVTYSDGLVEQLDPAKQHQFGEARLERLLVEHRTESGGATIDRAVDALTAWAGGAGFADDVTVMCVDWVG